MRVLLDASYALRGHSGTATYIRRLHAALEQEGVDVALVTDGRQRASGGALSSLRNLACDVRWTQLMLARATRPDRVDVLHHPLPAHTARSASAQVVTVHDLAFARLPAQFDPGFRRWASLAHRHAARAADAVVCVSQTTRRDALARWGLDPTRIVVALHGPGQASAPADPTRPSHFLYVGDDEPRKNLGVLLEAYQRYRAAAPAGTALDLVLAGRVRRVGSGVRTVVDPDLPALLASAVALVHPALYEGFGLTPLEAMSAGVPVLAARSPGVTEVCADAALYADPYDAGAFAAALTRLASEPAQRAELAGRGHVRAREFSWQRSARDHIRAYTLAAGT